MNKMIRIAIVDDKQINRTGLQEKLYGANNIEIVLTAANGEEFLDKMKSCHPLPDVVFMDIDMPVMDGIAAVNAGSVKYPNTRYLMLTVFDDDEKIFDAIKAGAVGYLLKDESPERLINALYEVIEYGGAPMSPRIARKSLKLLAGGGNQKASNRSDVLGDKEMEVLKGLVDGMDYKKIAERMNLSPLTVRTHITNIYKKLHVNNKAQAINLALKNKWFMF